LSSTSWPWCERASARSSAHAASCTRETGTPYSLETHTPTAAPGASAAVAHAARHPAVRLEPMRAPLAAVRAQQPNDRRVRVPLERAARALDVQQRALDRARRERPPHLAAHLPAAAALVVGWPRVVPQRVARPPAPPPTSSASSTARTSPE
jgi:hypothetical protein